MKLLKVLLACFFLCSLSGCKRYYLEVSQQIVNQAILASTHVGSPDPRQCPPPLGRRLIISWQVPKEIFDQHPHIDLNVMFWNYTEERTSFTMEANRGYVLYTLIGSEFLEKGGILSYKAQLVTESGQVYRSWKQQLWVDLIKIEDEGYVPPPQPCYSEPDAPKESHGESFPSLDRDPSSI